MTAMDPRRGPLPPGRFPAVHYVLAGRTAVRDALTAFTLLVAASDEAQRRNGGGSLSPRVGLYIDELTAALGVVPGEGSSADGTEELPQVDISAGWTPDDTVDVNEAAALLGLTPRRTRQLAVELGGRKVNGSYRMPRLEVLAELERRRGERGGSPDSA